MFKLLLFLAIISLAIILIIALRKPTMKQNSDNALSYIALGDSYTIGEDVRKADRFPDQLVAQLKERGVDVELVANPSVTGWTTQNLIDRELPVFDESEADLVTLLIGVNDWVQGVSPQDFRKNFAFILDHVMAKLVDPTKLIILTIPDFAKTPTGARYTGDRDGTKGIEEFNQIIKEESSSRSLVVVDIFPISQRVINEPRLTASDGLHPSGEQYGLWVSEIIKLF